VASCESRVPGCNKRVVQEPDAKIVIFSKHCTVADLVELYVANAHHLRGARAASTTTTSSNPSPSPSSNSHSHSHSAQDTFKTDANATSNNNKTDKTEKKTSKLGYLRLDGDVKDKDRLPILDQFHTDPNIRILIATLGGNITNPPLPLP
jgi:hypothetical protein